LCIHNGSIVSGMDPLLANNGFFSNEPHYRARHNTIPKDQALK
jgi:hypothetical protein